VAVMAIFQSTEQPINLLAENWVVSFGKEHIGTKHFIYTAIVISDQMQRS
jgi:hypothetical protein